MTTRRAVSRARHGGRALRLRAAGSACDRERRAAGAPPTPVNARLLAPEHSRHGVARTARPACRSRPRRAPAGSRGEPRGRFALPSEGPRHMPAPDSPRPAKQRDDRVHRGCAEAPPPPARARRMRGSRRSLRPITMRPARLASATIPAEVPSFFIGRFPIPPFLLPIYLAAADRYGVPWEVLAAINEIETDYGRDLAHLDRRSNGVDAVPASQLAPLRSRC